jgi:ElaB/YqjD/DUF883 family membrane-anchored ribosome-binding protein
LQRRDKIGSLQLLTHSFDPFQEKHMSDMSEVTKDKLIADVKLVIADSEELLRATAGQAGEKIAEIRARTADRLATAKIKLAEAEAAVVDKAKLVGRAADDYVHDNPWRSVGVAAGIGFIAGLLIGRR